MICFYSEADDELRQLIRPLLLAGYAVVAVEVDSGISGVEHGRQVLREITTSTPFWLIGAGDGGQAALLLAAEQPAGRVAGVAVCDAPGDWPFDGLAPLAVIDRYSAAVLLTVSAHHAEMLYHENEQMAELRRRKQLPVTLVTLDQSSGHTIYGKFLAAFEEWRQQTTDEDKHNDIENP